MTWTAPEVERPATPLVADERGMLDAWLEFHRATLLMKCAGLTAEQLKLRSCPPSTLTLLGLVRHLTDVERSWFRRLLAGEEAPPIYYDEINVDGDFNDVDTADPTATLAAYVAEVAACRAAVAGTGLDATFVRPRDQQEYSLRWVYNHMIEEYARHNGHADLLRERIDGATGD